MGCVKIKYSVDDLRQKRPEELDSSLYARHLHGDDLAVYRKLVMKAKQAANGGLIPDGVTHVEICRSGVYSVTGRRNEAPIKII
jgi:hypothetical protein